MLEALDKPTLDKIRKEFETLLSASEDAHPEFYRVTDATLAQVDKSRECEEIDPKSGTVGRAIADRINREIARAEKAEAVLAKMLEEARTVIVHAWIAGAHEDAREWLVKYHKDTPREGEIFSSGSYGDWLNKQ